jgi:hypothetical protein
MAEDTHIDELSWSAFIDRLAGPLRLERPERQSFGILMALQLVGIIWGDLAQLRAAARLIGHHNFSIDTALAARLEGDALEAWFGRFLQDQADPALPVPLGLLKPAWIADARTP